jgi:hypothetical protein
MKTIKILFLLSIAVFSILSCGKKSPYSSEYNSLMEQGYKIIPDVKIIESKFDTVSYIVNLGHPVAPEQWQTIFYISGWYECLYVQEFEVKNKRFVPKGDPELLVLEVTDVDGRTLSYSNHQVSLQGDDLRKFIESGFDLETIGFSPADRKTPPPEDFMEYEHRIHPPSN